MSSFNFRSEHVNNKSSSTSSNSTQQRSNNNNNTSNNNSNNQKTTSNNKTTNTPKTNNNNRKVNNTNNTITPPISTSNNTQQFYSSSSSIDNQQQSNTTTTINNNNNQKQYSNNSNNSSSFKKIDLELNEYIKSQSSPYPLIDIGINLTNYQFNNEIKNVLDRCLLSNVKCVILTGTSIKNSQHSIDLINKYNNHQIKMYSTLGIHPHDAKTFKNINDLKLIYTKYSNNNNNNSNNNNSNNNIIKMIGECGLDYNRMFSTKEEQLKCFKEQLKLGIELNLPLFCHEREAHLDFIKTIKEVLNELNLNKLPIPLIVHCFTGNEIELKKYLEMDFYIGLTDFISMNERGKELREILHLIPKNRLLIETDSPFMLNQKWKFKRNEPCLLPRVLNTILKCYNSNNNNNGKQKELTLEELARKVTENTCQLLNIQSSDL